MNTMSEVDASTEGSNHPDIETIFQKHLPTKLTATKRLYAAQIRKSYDAGLIEVDTVIKLCELVKSPSLTPNSTAEKVFMEILGLSSIDQHTTTIQRKFIQELVEWTILGVLPGSIMGIIKEKVIAAGENATSKEIDEIRTHFCLMAERIIKGVENKKMILDFRSIPPEVIPFLSQEVRKFMLALSRKNHPSGKERYNPNMIHHSQSKVLEKSLSTT